MEVSRVHSAKRQQPQRARTTKEEG